MIKNIAYFPSQTARNSGPVLNAVLDVFQGCGITVKENSWECDAAVIWSVLWYGRMRGNQAVYEHYRRQGKPVVIIEIGALYRGSTWKIAVNNITADGYYGHTENLDWDRPRKLNISTATSFNSGGNILIALQHQHSLQVANLGNTATWVLNQIEVIRQHSDRHIVIRPHPRSPIQLKNLPAAVSIETPKPVPHTYDSFDMHYDCHAVINYNSGPGIQAAIAGVRPIVHSTSLAWPVAVDLSAIEKPYQIDRDRWLVEICHTEYTLPELRRGTWLKRIKSALSAQ